MKNRKYLKWVTSLPCCVCQTDQDVCYHHIIGRGDGMMGGKASDFYTMPLCPRHHTGDEGIHPMGVNTWEARFGQQWEMVGKTLGKAVFEGVLKL